MQLTNLNAFFIKHFRLEYLLFFNIKKIIGIE